MTILVVEDQTMVREFLVLACAQALPAANVVSAGTGGAALASCRQNPPELILLDLVLPDGDGLDFLKDIFPGLQLLLHNLRSGNCSLPLFFRHQGSFYIFAQGQSLFEIACHSISLGCNRQLLSITQ